MRLTEKIKNNYYMLSEIDALDGKPNLKEHANKLGQLEDIEEEFDIDLIKAVELCKQVNSQKVVYIKEEWGISTLKILDELDIELFNHRLYVSARGMYTSLDLYDYGKTWALTEKELL